ncbi:hypothetical protein KDJ56_03275 [Brevibacillus composti]|uniref:Uncharacterized protein n=1 Tax=Brevibacillus composti TaxID=2796470 RepID=A0A7T5JP05_9BACL|nr:hypothetical protein [Brevibacillus composti]QQE74983.1 hypothetical protein JD108_03270 [Brevibacillus composti]QUO42068.1 hypothetical protein KDJ56_03275 [Brevibacillus composti]
MKFNELELKKLMKKDFNALTIEERIQVDILNFIRTIHLNKQDFYSVSLDSKYYGDLPMTFKKNANCLIGHCRVLIKDENRYYDYLFTENGYERLNDLLKE